MLKFNTYKLFLSFSVSLLTVLTLQGQTLEQLTKVDYNIKSNILGENRTGEIHHINKKTSEKLITFYILDGEWNIEYIKNTINFYRRWNRIPEVRLVSINHKNRTNDLTPSEDAQNYPGSGNASNFLMYVKEELIPYVNTTYGKSSQDILVGHSFGGLFALYVLGVEPDIFEGYIAISPSTWWKDKYLYDLDYKNNLNNLDSAPFIFLSTAEFDSGATKPSNEDFVKWFDNIKFNKILKIDYNQYNGENHFTNYAITFQQALNTFFPGPELKTKIETMYAQGKVKALKEWYQSEKEKLKARLSFPEEAILALSLKQIRAQNNEDATKILEWLLSESPNSGNGYYYLGYNEAQAGNIKHAKEAYNKALTKNLPERVKIVIRNSLKGLSHEQTSIVEKVLEGIVSTDAVEYGIAISKSQDTIYFVRHDGNWGNQNNPPSDILITVRQNGNWQKPVLAEFSMKEYNDSDIFIAPDNTIFFTSNRPYQGKQGEGNDIFKIEYQNGKWSEPLPLSNQINTPNMESSPSTNGRGDLYFISIREDGIGMGDIYMAEKSPEGIYQKPKIVAPISTEYGEWNVFVAPDNSYLIFESSGRPNAKSGYGDLYYSINNNGEWQKPKTLSILNTTGSDLHIRLSPDKKYFYYASSERLESRNVDLFRVSAEEVLKLMN